jgi:tetratricopeptide (TPR) repeat protein
MAATSLGISAVRQKDWAAAEPVLRRATALWTKLDAHESEHTPSFAYLALALARSGRLTEARRHADKALSTSERSPVSNALALSVLAELELLDEHPLQALATSEKALAVIHSHDLFEEVGLARLVNVRSLLACNRRQGAAQALEDAAHWLEERAQRIGDPTLRAMFLTNISEHAALLSLARDMSSAVD